MNLHTDSDKFYSVNKRSVSIKDNYQLFIAPEFQLPKQIYISSPLMKRAKVNSFLQRFNDYRKGNMRFNVFREYRYKLPDNKSLTNKVGRKFGWTLYQAGACRLRFEAGGNKAILDVDNSWLHFNKQQNSWLLNSTNVEVQDYCLEAYSDDVINNGWQLLHPNGGVSIFNNNGYQLRFTNSKTKSEIVIDYDYDHSGNLLSAKNRRGHQVTFVYDVYGRPISFSNPKGETTHYKYDAKGRLVAVIKTPNKQVSNVESEYYYYDNKRFPHFLTGVVKNNNLVFQCEYDSAENQLLISQ